LNPLSRAGPGGTPWINPIGGLGDTLMLSGVLKLVHEMDHSRRFNLVRRTSYLGILKGHPAIAEIGYPPPEARIIGTDYWSKEEFESGQRAFQVLAGIFGLHLPAEERLYLPGGQAEDRLLQGFIPWGRRNILIAPASASPRKGMSPFLWHRLVDMLRGNGSFVLQAGRLREQHIRNAYSLLGLTTPRQLAALVSRCDAVVTSDNFVMHAAHLTGTPAVVLWGPTDHRIYGYREQIHLQAPKTCGPEVQCIGPDKGDIYHTPCPMGPRHCLDQLAPEDILLAVQKILGTG
jgi:ADP-heptose:LPS heptosyltransferase